jgi:hypothetical protein
VAYRERREALRSQKGTTPMQPDYAPMQDLPAPTSTRIIDFEKVEIRTLRSFPPQHVLVVSGTKPYMNMEVTLEPLTFIRQPEYWGIEVVGRLPGGIGLPALAPYQVSIPLAGIVGTKGIEVIGATRSEKVDLVPEPSVAIVLRRDDRPVDGELRELTITPDPDGFTATLHTAHVDRIAGGEVESTKELATGLAGTITATEVRLSRDDRPADGLLKELVVLQNAEGTFDATLRTAFFDQMNGTEHDETVEIGSGLTRS